MSTICSCLAIPFYVHDNSDVHLRSVFLFFFVFHIFVTYFPHPFVHFAKILCIWKQNDITYICNVSSLSRVIFCQVISLLQSFRISQSEVYFCFIDLILLVSEWVSISMDDLLSWSVHIELNKLFITSDCVWRDSYIVQVFIPGEWDGKADFIKSAPEISRCMTRRDVEWVVRFSVWNVI